MPPWHRLPFIACASRMLGAALPLVAQRAKLSFDNAISEDPRRPHDWTFFGGGYDAALDLIAHDGQRSLRLVRPRAGGTAAVSQTLNVSGWQASRVRLSGYVRTRDATGGTAGLALMVRGSDL